MALTRIILLIIGTSLWLCGFGSCSPQLSDLCHEPPSSRFESERAALASWRLDSRNGTASTALAAGSVAGASSRSPASTGLANLRKGEASMPAADREYWRDWSTAKLEEVESLLDLTYAESSLTEVHDELGHIANDLVSLYGYSSLGKADQMMEVLRQIEDRRRKISSLACH